MSLAERLGLLLLALFLFLPGIGKRDLWNPDEPRYAEVAREMRLTGDYLVPHLNGRIYAEKPPLLFWLIAASSFATGGVNEVSARIPSLVAGFAAIALLFSIARRLFDRRVAWYAVLIFGASGRILWQARVGQIDMLLLALVALAMYGFVRGWVEERPAFYRLFFVAAGLATLAKGPVGLLPPLLSVLLFAWLSGERRRLREMRIGTGVLIWAGISLAWLVPAALSGGGAYLETLLYKQNVQRFADPWHHFQPVWYYLTTVPADFFPWTLFLPGALWVGWRRTTGEERRGFTFALSWVAATILFFSISPAKRTVYVLQMFPALALLVALFFAEVERSRHLRRWIVAPAALLALVLALLPLAIPRLAERQPELATLGQGFVWIVTAVAALLAVAAAVALVAASLGRAGLTVQSLAAGMALAAAIGGLVLLPRFDPLKSFRPISEKFVALSSPEEPYAIYARLEAPVLFYTRRFAEILEGDDELRAWLSRPGRSWLFIERRELEKLEAPLPLAEIGQSADRGKSYRLFARPEPAVPSGADSPGAAPVDPAAAAAPSSSGLAQVR
jgi:4-amino-4-deoxy-L-arabinose transferase-like glycosyltransferase